MTISIANPIIHIDQIRPIEYVCFICIIGEIISKLFAFLWNRYLYKYCIYGVYKKQKVIYALRNKAKYLNTPDQFAKYAKAQRRIAQFEKELAESRK